MSRNLPVLLAPDEDIAGTPGISATAATSEIPRSSQRPPQFLQPQFQAPQTQFQASQPQAQFPQTPQFPQAQFQAPQPQAQTQFQAPQPQPQFQAPQPQAQFPQAPQFPQAQFQAPQTQFPPPIQVTQINRPSQFREPLPLDQTQSRLPLAIEPISSFQRGNVAPTLAASTPSFRENVTRTRTVDVPISSLGKVNYDPDFEPIRRSPMEFEPEIKYSDAPMEPPEPESFVPQTDATNTPPLEILPANVQPSAPQQMIETPQEVQQVQQVEYPINHAGTVHVPLVEECDQEEEDCVEEYKEEHESIWKNPVGYPLILLIVGVIIVIIINMIFIARAPSTDRNGNLINSDLKWSAMIMSTAIIIILAVIFAGFLYYARRLTLVNYQWLIFLLTIVFLFLIALFAAYLAGWWMNIGFLWAPTSAPPS